MAKAIAGLALAWSLFQLWIASPLPFIFRIGVLNDTETRSIHLAFALLLAFLAYPAFKRSPRDRVPLLDVALGLVAAASAAYLFIFYEQLAQRPGNLTTADLVTACIGIPLLLERPAGRSARRWRSSRWCSSSTAWPAPGCRGCWRIAGELHGDGQPPVDHHRGRVRHRPGRVHQLRVSLRAVRCAARARRCRPLLHPAGVQPARPHARGPAKAAVVASGMTGLISGSSIANVVTTGTFTIPMMKKVGFSKEKAGAVEVASSVNGQIMPPVMGAAAFLMVEYIGMPYVEIIKHAFLPAAISYIALLYIVHLEALKQDMQPIGTHQPNPAAPADRLRLWCGADQRPLAGGLLRPWLAQTGAWRLCPAGHRRVAGAGLSGLAQGGGEQPAAAW